MQLAKLVMSSEYFFLKKQGLYGHSTTERQFSLLKSELNADAKRFALLYRHWMSIPITVSWASPSCPCLMVLCVESFILFGNKLYQKQELCGYSKNREPIVLVEKGTKPLISRHLMPIPITVSWASPSCPCWWSFCVISFILFREKSVFKSKNCVVIP